MKAHPAGQSSVPAETKSAAANTANSTISANSALPMSALRSIAYLHENGLHRVYSGAPTSKTPDRTSSNAPSTHSGE